MFHRRKDGTLEKNIEHFQKIFPYIMKSRTESCVYFSLQADVTGTLEYIHQHNSSGKPEKLSLFIVLLAAMVRTAVEKPYLNRFIAGRKIYRRNSLQISYIVKQQMNETAREVSVKQTFTEQDTLADVAAKVNRTVSGARSSVSDGIDPLIRWGTSLPRCLLSLATGFLRWLDFYGLAPRSVTESDPLFTSAFVANIGSLGVDAPYHHLYEWGNASLFIVMGMYRRKKQLQEDGSTQVREMVTINFTIDERIADGFYFARALKLFQHYLENPASLQNPKTGETKHE